MFQENTAVTLLLNRLQENGQDGLKITQAFHSYEWIHLNVSLLL